MIICKIISSKSNIVRKSHNWLLKLDTIKPITEVGIGLKLHLEIGFIELILEMERKRSCLSPTQRSNENVWKRNTFSRKNILLLYYICSNNYNYTHVILSQHMFAFSHTFPTCTNFSAINLHFPFSRKRMHFFDISVPHHCNVVVAGSISFPTKLYLYFR